VTAVWRGKKEVVPWELCFWEYRFPAPPEDWLHLAEGWLQQWRLL